MEYIQEKVRARKPHPCKMGDGDIQKGEEYWAFTIGGAGLGSIKFPNRTHLKCGEAFLAKSTTSGLGQEVPIGNTHE